MTRAATAAIVASLLVPPSAVAEPAVDVVGCPFTADAVDDALTRELTSLGRAGEAAPPTVITCSRGGSAQLAIASTPPVAREIELDDVPAALAPRVVAMMLAAAIIELRHVAPPPPGPTTTTTTTSAPSTPTTPTAPAAIEPRHAEDVDVARTHTTATVRRRPTLLADRRLRVGASLRLLTRGYRGGPGPLWGAGASLVIGPFSLGLVHARAGYANQLGDLTASITAVDGGVTLACSRADTTTCIGARVELGRGAVTAVATEPAATGSELASIEAHAAVEITIARDLRAVELAAVIAAGGGAGVVARANGVEAARLAGWTLGAALEVRR